jgi:predicted glycoside hydrolase/deacetylase ChbG (UPF0249 family)
MEIESGASGRLIISADDWGYSPRYNAGIEEAARAGAIDAVAAMVLREHCDPGPLRDCGVEMGLHLELTEASGRSQLLDEPRRQADAFARLFGFPPAFLDGHHHCHALAAFAAGVERLALELGVPLRATDETHRNRLSQRGIAHADRLVGRTSERDPALPRVLSEAIAAKSLPWGTTEWFVHPGRRDPGSGSDYDAGREEDLELLLELSEEPTLRPARASHREALATRT